MHSFLGVPILLGEYLLGSIYLADKIGYHEFFEDDERVIETLAAYAAVAISNARLYNDLLKRDHALTQRNEDLALLNDVAIAQASSLELDDVLDRTLNRVMAYLGMEAGEIFLREEGGEEFKLALHHGEGARAFWTKNRFRLGEGTIGTVAKTGKPLVSDDLANDVRFLRQAVVNAGFCRMVSIPMTARGIVVAVLNVATCQPREFSHREILLLTAIGSWAGITIENARLHRQARRLAVLEERERIGMDLHDGIVQSIYSVGLVLDYARMVIEEDPLEARQKIEQAVEGLNAIIGDIRSYISDLRPRQIGSEGLMEGVQQMIDEIKGNAQIEITLSGPNNGVVSLPGARATALFHICQEALTNAVKHAHAQHINVRIWTEQERAVLEVADDGKGFDLNKMNITMGQGIGNMHTRARKMGGDVEITTEPEGGTTVMAWVPTRE
jgi:signal transduction histidine kinase